MPTRKRIIRDEAIPQVKAQQIGHAKHSENYSKKRNERFSVPGLRTRQPRKKSQD